MSSASASVPKSNRAVDAVEKHPSGLSTLFFTEMWERFSYYGMRALLVLFMVDAVRGGMGLTDKVATAIYGLYTAAAYLAALPGGWLADRILGAQKAVWYGGIIIATGHFTLAIPGTQTFFLGLILVIVGTGLLKPNVSALLGELYPGGGARKDAGFSIFYMGINLGAFLGPFVCGTLGEKYNWHLGFGAAGVGMVIGLIQFRLRKNKFSEAGLHPGNTEALKTSERLVLGGGIIGLIILMFFGIAGFIHFDAVALAKGTTTALVGVAAVYFGFIFFFCRLTRPEKQNLGLILILCAASALFWAGFEQSGSSFNLFAERFTRRDFGFVIPTSWFQSLEPVFVIALAPVFAGLWVKLGRRNLDPSAPLKFGFGLIMLALGFLVLAMAAMFVARGQKVWPSWLALTYLLHTFGELCVSPVGLSSVTSLAPRRLVGQMMGAWFLATSLGNLIAGRLAGEFDPNALDQMPGKFLKMVILPAAVGCGMLVVAFAVRRIMRNGIPGNLPLPPEPSIPAIAPRQP